MQHYLWASLCHSLWEPPSLRLQHLYAVPALLQAPCGKQRPLAGPSAKCSVCAGANERCVYVCTLASMTNSDTPTLRPTQETDVPLDGSVCVCACVRVCVCECVRVCVCGRV
jgi:hypothetical protein